MLEGPIPATAAVLEKAHLSLDDIELFEVNEAFASVVLAWEKSVRVDQDTVNVNGGAIAIGHPLGASGARIMADLVEEMRVRKAKHALQTMCCAGGLGTATVLELID
jgi:acetyl-CoA acetyltransferase